MTKQEFIQELGQSLFHKVSNQEYENSIDYYSNYIDEAIQSGQKEEDVIEQLGNPRLIAKAIINAQTSNQEMDPREPVYEEGGQGEREFPYEKSSNHWNFHINGKPVQMKWYEKVGLIVVGIIIIMIILGILGVAFSILWNIVLPIAIVVLIFKMIQKFFRK